MEGEMLDADCWLGVVAVEGTFGMSSSICMRGANGFGLRSGVGVEWECCGISGGTMRYGQCLPRGVELEESGEE
jgi:hypothetical protein